MNDDNSNRTIKSIEDNNDDVKKGSIGNVTYPDKLPQQDSESTDDSGSQNSNSQNQK